MMTSMPNMSEKDSTESTLYAEVSDNKDQEIATASTVPCLSVSQETPAVDGNTIVKGGEENDTRTKEEVKEEISEFVKFNEKDIRKRKRSDEIDEGDVLSNVFLRSMYPLNNSMDKTITVGVFKSLNFKPAVLLNHCGKTSLIFTVEMWDTFTKYTSIIEAYLLNNLTGRKTAIGFDSSDIEIDNIRLRGSQYVRFRDLTKHNKKILLTFEEFHVLSNLIPVIIRYIQQLITYGTVISDYLYSSENPNPEVPLIYGPIDHSIYNRLPQEVSFHRRTKLFFKKVRSDEAKPKASTTNEFKDNISNDNKTAEDIVP